MNFMGRRRKNNDFAFAEALAGLAGFMILGWMFSPGFRAVLQVLLAIIVVGGLVVLFILVLKGVLSKSSTPPSNLPAQMSRQVTNPTDNNPLTIGEEIAMQNGQPTPELTISEELRKIDWFQFEKLIELIYLHRGFSVERLGGANPDGGVDLIVESPSEKFVVQCKHWKKWTVGVRHIREFLGTMTDTKTSKGIFITLTGYSGDAKQLADKHNIQILNESDVIKMLEESELMYSKEIQALFSDPRKLCPKCENELVLRTARLSRNQFWGCSTYPRCKFTMKFEGE
jgi:Restriction endonuclease/Topoisomerase DNA binding C4 zinc finger